MKDHIIEINQKTPLYLYDDTGDFWNWRWTLNPKAAKRFEQSRAMDISVKAWSHDISVSIHKIDAQEQESDK